MITFTIAGDGAGDVGLNFDKGASRYFVPAFVAYKKPDHLWKTLIHLRQTLHLRETRKFKFHRMTSTAIRNEIFSTPAQADFEAHALIVDKIRLPKISRTADGIEIHTRFITELISLTPAEL